METKPLISVIIPVYGVEEYLDRCVNSVLQQNYSNLEIILIDDGSPDRCGEICDTYEKKDPRVKVIHKENGGLSDARNAGLDVMNGEWVTCIDSDDFVSSYYISNLYEAIEKSGADIAMNWFELVYQDSKIVKPCRLDYSTMVQVVGIEKCFEKMLYQDGVETCAWGKLYRAEYFKDIRYPKGKLYEDIPVTYKLIEKSNKIAILNTKDYYYFQREDSIQNEVFNVRKLQAVEHMNDMKENISKEYPQLKRACQCRYFSTVCNILFQIPDEKYDKERTLLWNEVKKNRKVVVLDRKGRKKARIAALISYMGYKATKKIYSWTVK